MYFNAFRLPDLVFNVLILGAVTTAFIPVFTDYFKKKSDDAAAWKGFGELFCCRAPITADFNDAACRRGCE